MLCFTDCFGFNEMSCWFNLGFVAYSWFRFGCFSFRLWFVVYYVAYFIGLDDCILLLIVLLWLSFIYGGLLSFIIDLV